MPGFVVPHWDAGKVDHVEAISDSEAIAMTRRLAERLGPDAVIVTLAVDTAFKYMSVSPFANL